MTGTQPPHTSTAKQVHGSELTTWTFGLRLNQTPLDTEADILFEAGLDDAVPCGDRLWVDREAVDLVSAVVTAANQVRTVPGLWPLDVVMADCVTLADAAQRLDGATTATLRAFASGERGPGAFPAPLVVAGKISVYSFRQILAWWHDVLGEAAQECAVWRADLSLARQAIATRLKDQSGAAAARAGEGP